ncbi:MAG: aminotransferase class V-fold PLP-dependent enzyme [Acidobacteriota bacterium]
MIYFDNNATTRIAPEVIEAMLPYLNIEYGNPSSAHSAGRRSAIAVEDARASVAQMLGAASADEIVFTATGSESDNWAILGSAGDLSEKPHFITSRIEHSAVSKVFESLENRGCDVTWLDVDDTGALDNEALCNSLNDRTKLVSLMLANNETGIIFPVARIATLIKERSKALFHVDGVNAVGKIPIDLSNTDIDLFSLAGHKFHAPKGIGALYIRSGVPLSPIVLGGGQEHGRRSGTEAVHQIVGLGAAAKLVKDTASMDRVSRLRNKLESGILKTIPNTHLNGTADRAKRLPNTSSISFGSVNGEMLMARLDDRGVCVSTGSACHTQAASASGVLQAMNIPHNLATGAIRFSLGRYNTEDEVDNVLNMLPEMVRDLRRLSDV